MLRAAIGLGLWLGLGVAQADEVTVALVATTDVHGHLEPVRETFAFEGGARTVERGGAALFGGFLANLRRSHPGRVVLLDAGDMMQGTLLSNLGEGRAVVLAMNALGYDAAAVGNHEFDFGPDDRVRGPRSIAREPGDDPRGALKARAAEAKFPWLTANVRDASGRPVGAPTVKSFAIVERAGVKIGIVGATSADTPRTTIKPNLVGLTVSPLAPAVAEAARAARKAGAQAVVALVHAGGECTRFDAPDDLSSCLGGSEVFELARALARDAPGAVDAIFGGHTHQGVAHRVAGIPIAQAWSYGAAFSRIDLTIDRASGKVTARLHPPEPVCPEVLDVSHTCDARTGRGSQLTRVRYEGADVAPDPAVAKSFAAEIGRAAARGAEKVGVKLDGPIPRAHREESPLGNLVADVLRAAAPGADVGLTNGGGLRSDLPGGDLTYGALFEALPFDNKLARVTLDGATFARIVQKNLRGQKGILSLSGAEVTASCRGRALDVAITVGGKPLDPKARYLIATSDFLALGGDDFGPVVGGLPDGAVKIDEQGAPLRDLVAAQLVARKRPIGAAEVYRKDAPRIRLPARRPFHCPVAP
jgi:5'-nucleotidase